MASLEELRDERAKKLNSLKDAGIDAYPAKTTKTGWVADVLSRFDTYVAEAKEVTVCGRLTALRRHGGSIFGDVYDGTGKIQAYFKKDLLDEKTFALVSDSLDVGDFVQSEGLPFLTGRSEKTIEVHALSIISKSLRPQPDKWHGLQDVEERYRRRYLDLLSSPEVRTRFQVRSKIITEIREFLNGKGYMEVETPMLQPLAGGATALPFKTHHNYLDIDLYLRIAPELYLKQLLIGGFPKVYEIGRNFRNEGIDVTHNPEFTMLEFYEAYADASYQMANVEELVKTVAGRIFGKLVIDHEDGTIDLGRPFKVISYLNLIEERCGITNPKSMDFDDLKKKAHEFGVSVEKSESWDKIVDNIYKKVIRPTLIEPTFIVDYPAEFSPFAKRMPNDKSMIDRFQLLLGGFEIVNAFSELNDPVDQMERFAEQEVKRKKGEVEISPNDSEFIEAMEYGMPPAGGVGLGIDRLAMVFTNTKNIREVIFFPTLRPRA